MRTLLVSPWRDSRDICGDDIVTHLLRTHPPEDVEYVHYLDALRDGSLRRTHAARAWFASLWMHSRPPAGVAYSWPNLPPLPYRLLGKLIPDRPDEDIQWLGGDPGVDLIHAFSFPVQLSGALARLPLVLSTGCGNTDLVRQYYGIPEAQARRIMARDRRLLRRLGVEHELYNTARASAVVVPSEYARRLHLEAGVPEEKLRVVRLGFETPAIAPREPDGTVRFTLVGHQFFRKGGRAVAQAFARLHRLHPEARLTIVSHVAPEALGVPLDGITLIERLPRSEIYARIYPETDVVLLPSLAEGYGMSVVEGMSFGKPAIASRIAALQELVHEEETGLLVPPDASEELFEAMRRLMEDAALRARMGLEARRRFEAEHAAEATNRSLKAVYGKALGAT
ncbi:MAG TPA: glycosyltransferase family 4 protein [Oscillatoriaceae cyanobacterium]